VVWNHHRREIVVRISVRLDAHRRHHSCHGFRALVEKGRLKSLRTDHGNAERDEGDGHPSHAVAAAAFAIHRTSEVPLVHADSRGDSSATIDESGSE